MRWPLCLTTCLSTFLNTTCSTVGYPRLELQPGYMARIGPAKFAYLNIFYSWTKSTLPSHQYVSPCTWIGVRFRLSWIVNQMELWLSRKLVYLNTQDFLLSCKRDCTFQTPGCGSKLDTNLRFNYINFNCVKTQWIDVSGRKSSGLTLERLIGNDTGGHYFQHSFLFPTFRISMPVCLVQRTGQVLSALIL